MCLIHKHSNLQEWCDRFFRKYISVATTKICLRGSTLSYTQQHMRIPEPPSHVVAFPILADHTNISFLLDASLGQVRMSKMWSSNNSSARPRHRVEQSGDRQVALNCRREGHFVFLSYKSTLLSAHCLFLL